MAANLRNNAFLSSLMFILLIGSSYGITISEINTICGKTLNPTFCRTILNIKSSSPNIQALAKTILNDTQASASETLDKLQSLLNSGAATKPAYQSCLDEYKSTVGNIDEAFEFLASGDGMGMNMRVSAALDGADACIDAVKTLGLADALVIKNSEKIKDLCGIALVISNMLPRNV